MKEINIQKTLMEDALRTIRELLENEMKMQTINNKDLDIIKRSFIDLVFTWNRM